MKSNQTETRPDSPRLPAPTCSPLAEKLESIRYCVAGGHDEDAQQHLYDLLSALRLRAALGPAMDHERLTPEGLRSLRLLENARDLLPSSGQEAPKEETND